MESLLTDINMIFRKILDYVVNDNARKYDDIIEEEWNENISKICHLCFQKLFKKSTKPYDQISLVMFCYNKVFFLEIYIFMK